MPKASSTPCFTLSVCNHVPFVKCKSKGGCAYGAYITYVLNRYITLNADDDKMMAHQDDIFEKAIRSDFTNEAFQRSPIAEKRPLFVFIAWWLCNKIIDFMELNGSSMYLDEYEFHQVTAMVNDTFLAKFTPTRIRSMTVASELEWEPCVVLRQVCGSNGGHYTAQVSTHDGSVALIDTSSKRPVTEKVDNSLPDGEGPAYVYSFGSAEDKAEDEAEDKAGPRVGDVVRITGLKKVPELNGLCGCLLNFDENDGRFEAYVKGWPNHVRINPDNLVVLPM